MQEGRIELDVRERVRVPVAVGLEGAKPADGDRIMKRHIRQCRDRDL